MKRMVLALAVLALAGAPASGHHSFASYYFEDQSVSVAGELVEFDYRAPHAWVHLTGRDSAGAVRKYAAEWANPNRLSRDNVTRDTLRPGDQVIITGSPGRNPAEYKIHLKRIERPIDGWKWEGRRRR